MKNKLNKISNTFFLILFFLTPNVVFGEIIKSIDILGNDRIPDETIKMFTDVKIGDDIDLNETNRILKNLYKSNFFKKVDVKINNNILTIQVDENPLIENVSIEGIKAKKNIKKIKQSLNLKSRSAYDEVLASKDKKRILEIMKELGYYFSKVETTIEFLDDNKVNINYNIDQGEKARIKKISFIGNKIFKDKKLKNIIVTEEYKFWKFLSGKKFLREELLSLDERLLRNYYLNKGYYAVEINSSFAKLVNPSEFEIVYNIDAKNKYNFNNLTLDLPEDFDTNNFVKLENLFKSVKGEPYSINIISNILDEIDKIVLDEEFKSIESTVTTNIKNNKIDLVFEIKEGEKYSLNRINIFGNNITQENVIRNQLLIDEGDEFNSILANKSINNIKSLGIFKDVTKKIDTNETDKTKSIDITVQEKATGEIVAGAGFGTDGSTLNFAIKENNYLGTGITVDSSLTVSTDTIKGKFSVENPNYKNSDKSVYTLVQALETDRIKNSGYKSNKMGFGFGTNFEYQDDFFLGIGQNTFFEKIETDSTASTRQQAQKGNYFDTFLNLDFNYDKRNQKFKTDDGFRSFYSVDLPVVSDNNTLTNFYNFSVYDELFEDNISQFSIYLKAANSITNDDVKLSERIYLPGNKLRGFVSGKVGPKDGDDYIGGNYAAALNFSSTLPQILPSAQTVDFLMFVDVANVWGIDYDSSLNDSNELRSSIGLGLDWFTAIGPLTFSLAQPISKSSTDKTETFKFNIGTTF